MKTLLLCTALAVFGLGITDRAHAQRGGSRGGYSAGHGYYGGQGYYGGNYYRGYGNGGLYGGYGNYSYAYPYLGISYGNTYGNTYRDSFYAPSYPGYSGEISPAAYQQNQPRSQTLIRVLLADSDAVVLFDGHKTSSLGRERTFFPPSLEAGYTYSYHVSASWLKDGRTVTETRTVSVVPGQPSVVDFTRAAPAERVAPPAKTKTPQ